MSCFVCARSTIPNEQNSRGPTSTRPKTPVSLLLSSGLDYFAFFPSSSPPPLSPARSLCSVLCLCVIVCVVLFSVYVQVEGGWKLSASFPVDSVGEYTLRLTRQVDVSKLKHISTRRSSEYNVTIPQMEVGIPVVARHGAACRDHGVHPYPYPG